MPDFTNKTIVVTGGAQGIGRAIAEYLLNRNACVAIADCDRETGEELVQSLNIPERSCFIPTDVGNEGAVIGCINQTLARFGQLMAWLIMLALQTQVASRSPT